MISVGAVVHVFASAKECSSLCTVLLKNDDGTFDVVDNFTDEEYTLVAAARLCTLEDWEVADARVYSIEDLSVLKERGNRMFSYYKDYRQALSYYKKAEALIRESFPILVFSEVLIEVQKSRHFNKTLDCISGIVQDVEDDGRVLIAFDTLDDEEIEDYAHTKALTALCPIKEDNNESRTIQRSIYMNMARCYSKLNLFAWGIRYASLALAISKVLDGEYKDATPIENDNEKEQGLVGEVYTAMTSLLGMNDDNITDNSNNKSNLDESFHKMCADALLVRSRCLLSLGRLKLIRTDLQSLAKYRYTGSDQKLESLSNEANNFRVQRFKSNKKMARHLGEWVQQSMLISEELKKQGEDSGAEIEVNALLMDEDDQ